MKILLSGATAGTNFGDFLFAKMFQEYVGSIIGDENVYWNTVGYHCFSEFFRKNLNYKNKFKLNDLKYINALIYISGGYFCGNDKNIKDYFIRFLNYFLIGLICICKGIPIAIIGVEAAKSKNHILDLIQRIILKKAQIVVVRNMESMDYVSKIRSSKAKLTVCTVDSVFAIEKDFFENCKIPDIFMKNNPKLFLHICPTFSQSDNHLKIIVPIVKNFLLSHPEYVVVLSADQYNDEQIYVANQIKAELLPNTVLFYKYDYPIALCSVLNHCDVIVTDKLHVGIMGIQLRKSVISFSNHTQKIQRLYKQLAISDRSRSLKTLSVEEGIRILNQFYNKPVEISDDIHKLAKRNFIYLKDFIVSL